MFVLTLTISGLICLSFFPRSTREPAYGQLSRLHWHCVAPSIPSSPGLLIDANACFHTIPLVRDFSRPRLRARLETIRRLEQDALCPCKGICNTTPRLYNSSTVHVFQPFIRLHLTDSSNTLFSSRIADQSRFIVVSSTYRLVQLVEP